VGFVAVSFEEFGGLCCRESDGVGIGEEMIGPLLFILGVTGSLFGFTSLLIFLQSSMPKKCPLYLTAFLLSLCVGLILFGIHIQIPDQDYCDDIYAHNSGLGRVAYQESLHPYDFSFNESKCIYSEDGTFIANSKYSIWGIRI
jgi:hypothetical protein